MIITFTPNPALDITYAVESVTLGASHRVTDVRERAGGKGLNTAAVLTTMGRDCVAVAPVGGPGRAAYAADLRARGVRAELVDSPVAVRRSIAVVERDGRSTLFNEAGAEQPAEVWDRVVAAVTRLAPGASVLTVSGSLPQGADPDLVRHLVCVAQPLGVRIVLDVGGDPLARALAASPTLVKPNLAEAGTALARWVRRPVSAGEAARMLVAAGAEAAVVSDGPRGLSLFTEGSGGVALTAWLPTRLHGNATGAGDALTASLAADLDLHGGLPADRDQWADVLRRAVAWSGAAVLQPVAGDVDPADVDRLRPTVEIEEIRV
jgi:tagatose 6-phosphate kinase